MTYFIFITFMLSTKKFLLDCEELYDIGFDLYDGKYKLATTVEKLLDTFIESHFTDLGKEIFYWYILENGYGQTDWSKSDSYWVIDGDDMVKKFFDKGTELKFGLYDKDMVPICNSTEELYNYLIKNCKK
jgi:hypothetical protein